MTASRRALASSAVLVLAALGATSGPDPAHAAPTRLCQGEAVTLEAPASAVTVRGTAGPDVIDGIGRNDLVIEGLGGDDVICSGPGYNLVVRGGDGADRLEGGHPEPNFSHGSVELDGGPGDDVVRLRAAGTVLGGEGDDRLISLREESDGYAHVDLTPGPGDDVITSTRRPASVLHFGGTAGVRISIPDGVADGEGHDTFTGIGSFAGSPGTDTFLGGPGNDSFHGDPSPSSSGAPDVAYGGEGNDALALRGRIEGGPGRDWLSPAGDGSVALGGPGDDLFGAPSARECPSGRCRTLIDGGTGRDLVMWESSAGRGVRVDLAKQRARHGRYLSTVRGIEDLMGSKRPDVLLGDRHDNRFQGGSGRDVLKGRGGADRLVGEAGRDRADGGPGRDRCRAEIRRSC